MKNLYKHILLLVIAIFGSSAIHACHLRVAVASSFLLPAHYISNKFQKTSQCQVSISSASSGKIYTQILHGAPFDVFLSADRTHPTLLAKNDIAIKESLLDYAVGSIVLWAPEKRIYYSGKKYLTAGNFEHFSISQPKVSPYGSAAQKVLVNLGLWGKMRPKIAFSENITIAMHYVFTGNAQAGIISASQALILRKEHKLSASDVWDIPIDLYQPIVHQGVILKRTKHKTLAKKFMQFLKNDKIVKYIKSVGYQLPSS